MRVGISLTSSHAVKDPREGARWMIERAAAARQSGLDSLFVGDHHATPGPYYQNVPILGRLLAEWGEAPAGCLFLLPLWNPVLVAEQVGTLAAVTRGRFIFQCGLGYDEAQFAAMGIALKYRPSAFEEESYSIVQRLLRGETVSSSGRSKFRDARLALRPAENVEYWIGGSAQPAIDRAVAHPRRGARSGRVLSRTLQGPRRTPKAAVAIRRDIYVGESAAEAEQAILTTGSRGIPAPALVAGSVESVAQQFAQLAVLGSTDVIVRHLTNDWPKVLASLARLRRVREALAGV